MKIKIGIVICELENNKQYVTDAYIQAIKSPGGLPIILPLVKSKSFIREYVELCDGFLFCGGGDITPLLFGQEPTNGIGKTDITLDLFQIRLMRQVLEAQKPVLAICRGMQVLNVACGGTIYQDLNEVNFDVINHMQTSLSRKDISHKVSFASKSHIHRILGPFAYTNSFHHQAVNRIGRDLIVTGTTGDDIVEAIEMPSHSFVLGVQWHPESMIDSATNMKQLFFALVRYAKAD